LKRFRNSTAERLTGGAGTQRHSRGVFEPIYNDILYRNRHFLEKNPIPFGSLLMLVIAGSVDFELHIFPAAWMWTTAWMPIIFVVGLGANGYRDRL
jgi:hypothetical protein